MGKDQKPYFHYQPDLDTLLYSRNFFSVRTLRHKGVESAVSFSLGLNMMSEHLLHQISEDLDSTCLPGIFLSGKFCRST